MKFFRFWNVGLLLCAACCIISCEDGDDGDNGINNGGDGGSIFNPNNPSEFDEWDGSSSDISWYNGENTLFQLKSAAQFIGFAELVNSGTDFKDKTVTLEVNVKLNEELKFDADHNVTNANELRKWQPIGNSIHPFTGIFDGKNHEISGVYCVYDDNVSTSEPAGLFGLLKYGKQSTGRESAIKNLCVTGSFVKGYKAGAIVGEVQGDTYNVEVINCSNASVVKGAIAGGVIGYVNDNGQVENCANTGYIESNVEGKAGGVIGECNGYAEYCYNLGEVKGRYAGGIIGMSDGRIAYCYNKGKIKVMEKAKDILCTLGGIIGEANGNTVITDCYSINDFEVFDDPQLATYVGGICSYISVMFEKNFPTVKNCYTVMSCNNYKNEFVYANPILGSAEGNNSNIKWSNCFTKNDTELRYNSTYRNEIGYVFFIDGTFDDNSGLLTSVEDRTIINDAETLLEALNAASNGKWKIEASENNGYPIFVQ